jgi:hypothetical protein
MSVSDDEFDANNFSFPLDKREEPSTVSDGRETREGAAVGVVSIAQAPAGTAVVEKLVDRKGVALGWAMVTSEGDMRMRERERGEKGSVVPSGERRAWVASDTRRRPSVGVGGLGWEVGQS